MRPGWSRRDWYDLLAAGIARAGCDPRIVDWEASVETRSAMHVYLTSAGGDVTQRYRFVMPSVVVTAHADGDTQTRSLNGYRGLAQQGGEAMLGISASPAAGVGLPTKRCSCWRAPNCPTGAMDVLLMPDQMVLQIHESIGHPLELDRILGDERNFAGTSFVTLDMFGSYRYGSDLLNITFDPTRPEELASYAFDDDGTRAEKQYLIRAGMLERPLGGALSQARAGIAGVANSRADNWNRPPIDRMSNLNLEPGASSLEQMIAGIERGVLMRTNSSWSIDDSRNKFQFGCEWGQLIENGQLTSVVKNPNYRGISANFWRNLRHVGDASTHAGARHAVLRQGRTIADHPCRPRIAGVRVLRRRRVRRRRMMRRGDGNLLQRRRGAARSLARRRAKSTSADSTRRSRTSCA